MVSRFFAAVVVMQVFLFTKTYQDNYAMESVLGKTARIDLLNALKIALNTAHPAPTKKERQAAFTFVKFLNISRSDDYLEAFYSRNDFKKVNKFLSFLNGIIFNGNPTLPVWKAAEILSHMVKTKNNPEKLENMRQNMRSGKQSRSVVMLKRKDIMSTNLIRMFNNPTYFHLKSLLQDVNAELVYITRRSKLPKNCEMFFWGLLPLILQELDNKLYSALVQKIGCCETYRTYKMAKLPHIVNSYNFCNDDYSKHKRQPTRKILAKTFRRSSNVKNRYMSKHLFYSTADMDDNRRNKKYFQPYKSMILSLK